LIGIKCLKIELKELRSWKIDLLGEKIKNNIGRLPVGVFLCGDYLQSMKGISMTTKKEKVLKKEEVIKPKLLTSKQEVADELKMSVYQFNQLLRRYPFCSSGAAGKLNGRWHIDVEYVWKWYEFVQRQEIRHPDARRMRPEEPPGLNEIRTREEDTQENIT
jgi:hypothetical protein